MSKTPELNTIERSFQDIPKDGLSESEQISFLSDLGWKNGDNWSNLLRSKRILIVSEAGTGKTYECKNQQDILFQKGEPSFYIELSDLARTNLYDHFSSEEQTRFNEWRTAQSDIATFFLDSIDELKLSLGSFERALKNLEKAIAGNLGRSRIIVTSRPTPIDEELFRKILPVPVAIDPPPASDEFADIAMARQPDVVSDEQPTEDWRNVALLPLSNLQIKLLASKNGVADPDAFLADIQQRNAEDFVRRPQDLIELCADWRMHNRIRSHRDQVASNINVKLKPRTDRAEKVELSDDKAIEGARRLALAATLSRKLSLRHSAEADRDGNPTEAPLDPSLILTDWSQDQRTTLLERPLFGFASYGRMRFHHRSVTEYLAAQHLLELLERKTPIKSIKRILFTITAEGEMVVKPSMRPVTAWVALQNDSILEQTLQCEPDVLLNFGDPESLTSAQKQRTLRAFSERHGAGGWRGLQVPNIQLHRFAAPELGQEVMRLWEAGIENPEVQEIMLMMIGHGKMTDCANIAYGIAIDSSIHYSMRINALNALIQLNDPRLAVIVTSIVGDAEAWPNRIARTALLMLFPEHISVELFCKALGRITENKRSIGDISWHLPRLIQSGNLSPGTLDSLRNGLTDLVLEGVAWKEHRWPYIASKKPFILPALTAVCLRQIEDQNITPEIMHSSGVSLLLIDGDYTNAEPIKQLKSILPSLPVDARRLLFEAEDAFLQALNPQSDAWKRYVKWANLSSLTLGAADKVWVLKSLSTLGLGPEYRALMLEAAINTRDESTPLENHFIELRSHVADQPSLLKRLDELAKPQKLDPKLESWKRKSAKRRKQEERREAKAHASWVMFWKEIVERPDLVFSPDRSENTAWNLWRAMARSGEHSRASGWNRRFIEHHFSKEIADRLRLALMGLWRKDRPTLRSERSAEGKGVFYSRWQLGLAAIAAESEDPEWARKLSDEEAKLALRYVSIELNGFPSWLEELVFIHPEAVDSVLGSELTAELAEPAAHHSSMLQDIRHASPSVALLFLPRLRAWLNDGKWRIDDKGDETAAVNRLRQVIQILMQHGDTETLELLHALAQSELVSGATDERKGVWLPFLMRISPAEGIDALEKTIKPHTPKKFGVATDWFGSLFGDSHRVSVVNLRSPNFTPQLLLRLARLAYQHIRPSDDMAREEGSYTPNARDDAERGRSEIISALLLAAGPDAWAAKIELANDPIFADFKDRAIAMARERAAEECDAATFSEAEILKLDKFGELPPQTRDEMFSVMVDRLDDIQDALLRDTSPRAAWALINEERIMRQVIARELDQNANAAYKIDQESVTADEKETDIRIRSTSSEHEAVIELKIGEKSRSAADLKATLRNQLLSKYMAAENCRAGCLLITTNSPKEWRHPDTNAKINLTELIVMLNEEASQIEKEMGGNLRLMARGLDLQPRLPSERAMSSLRK